MLNTIGLEYLEQITPPRNSKWSAYAWTRVPAVQAQINRLRAYANKRTGRVANLVNARVNELQSRLNAVTIQL